MIENVNEPSTDAGGAREIILHLLDVATPGFIHITRPDGELVYANTAWYEYTGIDRSTPPAKLPDLFHPEDRERVERALTPAGAPTRDFSIEYRLRRHDGSYHWIQTRFARVETARGQTVHWVGITSELEERRDAERRFREREERIRMDVPAADVVVWDMDVETGQVVCSDNASRIWGLTSGSAAEFWGRVHPEDRANAEATAAESLAQNKELRTEYRVLGSDGEYRWLHSRGKIETDANGKARRFAGISADVTQRKSVEAALRASEARYRSLALASSDAVWSAFADGRDGEGTEWWCALTGQTLEETRNWGWLDVVHPDDRQSARQDYETGLGQGTGFATEYRVRTTDGTYRSLAIRGVPVASSSDTREMVGTFADITPQRKAQEELRERERRFASVLANIPDIIAQHDRDHRVVFVSDAITRATGRPADDFVGKRTREMDVPDVFAERWDHALSLAFRTGRSITLDFDYHSPDGPRWYNARLVPQTDGSGSILSVLAVTSDVTSLREAEKAAQRTAAFHVSLGNAIPGLVWTTDEAGKVDFVNQTFTEYTGLTLDEFAPVADTGVGIHPDDREPVQARFRQAMEVRTSCEFEFRYRRKDGVYRWFLSRIVPLLDPQGRVTRWVGISTDIDDRKRAEQRLGENESRLRLALRAARAGTWDYDVAARSGIWSDECYSLYGVSPGTEATYETWLNQVHPDDQAMVDKAMEEAIASRSELDIAYRVRHPTEGERWLGEIGRTITDGGRVVGMSGITIDITERKRAEEGLRLSEERFRTALRGSPIAIFNQDRQLRYTWVHDPGLGIMGQPVLGRTDAEIWERPEDVDAVTLIKRRVLETGQHERQEVSIHVGGVRHVYDLTLEPLRDAEGETIGITGAVVDMSERKQIEERLRQSAKMEAIGQLAGGLAHDFNNQLHAMSGLIDFVARDPGITEVGQRDIAEIQNAAERMASLTRQLLAFSRQQVLVPETVDLNDAVMQTKPMLQRLIGSNLEMRLDLDPGEKWIRVDRTQLLQVLMNLVINARDAMPEGGQLTVQTGTRVIGSSEFNLKTRGRVGRGRYAMLTVRDTGKGIDTEHLPRIFEPFYTTKPVGEGTGLGLATVDGIVSQSQGHIWAESAPGQGSTFTILLPLTSAPASTVTVEKPPVTRGGQAGRVLVVDDEDLVRQVLVRTLEAEGFEVIEARDGQDALDVLESINGNVNLVLSDVVMPVMGGSELGLRLNQRFPELRLIWMSGYPRDTVFGQGRTGEGQPFLQKPIPPDLLIDTVTKSLRETQP
ncbi:MAG: PAS domain-containing protein [Gemmatimonadota bacterium]